jgi:phosphoglycolate phosphatase
MKTIIFDFDGTIADTLAPAAEIFQDLTHRPEPFQPQELQRLRAMKLAAVARELNVALWRVPFLLSAGRKRMRARIRGVALFGGMGKAIASLHASGYQLLIVSSNSPENIQAFLRQHHLESYFTNVYGGASLLGKARIIKRLLRRGKLAASDTAYVGDEVRDALAARLLGIDFVAVAWGYNDASVLASEKPAALVKTPAELAAYFM